MQKMLIFVLGSLSALLLQYICIKTVCWVLKPKNSRQLILLPLSGECEDLESRLRWQLFRIENSTFDRNALLVILDCGMSQAAKNCAAVFCKAGKNCCLCDKEQLSAIIQQHSICKGIEVVLY